MSLGEVLANEIGAAYHRAKLEGDGIDIAEYAMHKIAHAALGCLTGAISANDCASGALGGVAGAVVSEGYRAMTEPEMKAELNRIRGDLANRGWSEEQQSAYLNEQMLEWRARGVDLTKLSAGLFALVAGADVDVAAGTAGNVAENNVLPLLIIITKIGIAAYTAYELVQSAKKAIDLAEKALNGDLTPAQLRLAAKQLGIEIAIGLTISKLKLAEVAYDLAVKAGNKIGADKILRRIIRTGCGRNSFAPLTPILMADGSYRPIRSIGIGDLVASRNEFTGITGANRVTALPGDWHEDRVILTLEDKARGLSEVITTTLEHPFHVAGQGFVAAGQLEAGMTVSRWSPSASPLQTVGFRAAEAASGHLLVKAITITRSGLKKWRAYNLTVEGDHTYFVGKTNAWVHNVECGDVGPYGPLARSSVGDGLTPDHIPSYASVKKALDDLGVSMSSDDLKALRNTTTCVMVGTCDHLAFSRTFGGRNSAGQIALDARDLYRAAEADLNVWEKVWRGQSWSASRINQARLEIHVRNAKLFADLGIKYGP